MLLLLLYAFSAYASAKDYYQSIETPKNSKASNFIYGSQLMGYYETEKTGEKLKILPPTFSEPIEVFEKANNLTCIYRKKFKNPTSSEHTLKNVVLINKLVSPYYLLNGYTPFEPADKEDPKGHSVVFIINKLGEMIWSYLPDKELPSKDHRTRSVLAKTLAENKIGLLRGYERSYFEIIDWEGNSLLQFKPKDEEFHHDFIYRTNNELLTLSNSKHSIRKPYFVWRKPLLFIGSPLSLFDLSSGKKKSLWDYIDTHNPFKEKDWTWNAVDSTPEFSNFAHANSIDENESGYLVSLRNVNKLVFIDKITNQEKWSIETTENKNLFRQHHATFQKDGTILVFDNGRKESRILKLLNGKIEKEFKPIPTVFSARHGSAFSLESANIAGFFPNTTPGSLEPNRIIEFDEKSGNEVGRLEYQFGYAAAGYRAEPLNSLPYSKPYKGKVPACKLK